MKHLHGNTQRISIITAIAFLLPACSTVQHHGRDNAHLVKAHWSYSGEVGPDRWGALDPAFSACAKGKNQSPVNLTGFIDADLPPITFDYHSAAGEIVNNGHTIQANYQDGSSITVNGQRFSLKQFHFHSPSENTVDGESFPLEAHLVHADAQGNLAVIAVLFREGKANPALETLWQSMPHDEGETRELPTPVSANGILPRSKDYYRFDGSLTTPPCTEGVEWLVMKSPMSASTEQIHQFTRTLHHPNNRPVQPLNARLVLK